MFYNKLAIDLYYLVLHKISLFFVLLNNLAKFYGCIGTGTGVGVGVCGGGVEVCGAVIV